MVNFIKLAMDVAEVYTYGRLNDSPSEGYDSARSYIKNVLSAQNKITLSEEDLLLDALEKLHSDFLEDD